MIARLLVACLVLTAAGCSSGECDLIDPGSCDPGLVCEPVQGQTAAHCFPPVEVIGRIYDQTTGAGVSQAVVVALDSNDANASNFNLSGTNGDFTVRVPAIRTDLHGTPEARNITLQVGARDFAPYPGAIQYALPINTGQSKQAGGGTAWTLQTPATNVGLVPLAAGDKGHPYIVGTLEIAGGELAALITAQSSRGVISRTYADALGDFFLFNLPPDTYTVEAYTAGINYQATKVTVPSGAKIVSGVGIFLASAPTATVAGTVSVPSGATSVRLVQEGTFNATLLNGAIIPGVRAPSAGTAPNVTGSFSIGGVPDGRYVVLAGGESDGLVMAPATPPPHVVVSGGFADSSPTITLVTAVEITSPGGSGAVDSAGATPTFSWTAYPGAASYQLSLYDSSGNPVAFNPTLGASDTQVAYSGPPLASGQIYQWRLTALDGSGTAISRSEEEKGLFKVQ